ncbi:CRISPR-associated endonuclease Cas1 [Lusitaniella coriacea]|uniref:CRISPR-associated endonuclease Cas1 n=1 Tax=Lusitaniella coriacea TaxID=1983105 RepID=UPI003CED0502
MKIDKAPLVDMVVVASINRLQWDAKEDFEVRGQQVWLSQRGREKLRWELEKVLAEEDDLLLIRLSHQCVKGLPGYNRPNIWIDEAGFRIF